MQPEICTDRLWLRRGAPDDFEAVHAIYSIPEVARMVASWPIPADPERTRRVCEPLPVEDGIAGPILLGEQIIGNMGVTHMYDSSTRCAIGIFTPSATLGF